MSKFLVSEVQLLMRIDSPSVTRLYFYFEDKDYIYLVMDLARDGTLFALLRKQNKLTEIEALNVS